MRHGLDWGSGHGARLGRPPRPEAQLGRPERARSTGPGPRQPTAPDAQTSPAGADGHDSGIATEDLADIESTEDCEALVRAFYGKAMADEKIGWIFTDVAQLDLERHIPRITAFWATNLLGTKSYGGGAFGPHARLHEKAGGLRQEHFERWLVIWCQTVDELYDGPVAAAAKVHALRLANAFYGRLQMYPIGAESVDPAP